MPTQKEFTQQGQFIEQPIEQIDPKTVEQQQKDLQNAEISRKTKLYAIGLGSLGLIGYGVYKIPKLPDHINNETLKIVGVLFGGLVVGSYLGNVQFLSGNTPTPTERIFRNIGGGAMLGSLLYFINRGIFKTSVINGLKISTVLTLATLAYLIYNEESNKKSNSLIKK